MQVNPLKMKQNWQISPGLHECGWAIGLVSLDQRSQTKSRKRARRRIDG